MSSLPDLTLEVSNSQVYKGFDNHTNPVFQGRVSNESSVIQALLLKPQVMILMTSDFNTSVEIFVKIYSTMLYAAVPRTTCRWDIQSLATFITVIEVRAMQI